MADLTDAEIDAAAGRSEAARAMNCEPSWPATIGNGSPGHLCDLSLSPVGEMIEADGFGESRIEIPGEATLFRTVDIPPEQVVLPLAPGPNIPAMTLLCAVLGTLGLPLLVLGLGTFFGLVGSGELKSATIGVMAAGLLGLPGAFLTAPALAALRDLLRGSPLLVLGGEGFRDVRLRHDVAWSEVERAQLAYVHKIGLSGVQLKLRRPIGARHNGFRFGAAPDLWRRGSDEVFISVLLLNIRRHILAHVITGLVRRHGGEVIPPDRSF